MWKYKTTTTTTTLSNVPKSNRLNKVFCGQLLPSDSDSGGEVTRAVPQRLSLLQNSRTLKPVSRCTKSAGCRRYTRRVSLDAHPAGGWCHDSTAFALGWKVISGKKKICTIFFSVGCLIVALFGFTLSSKTQTWLLFLPRKLLSGCRLIPVHTH